MIKLLGENYGQKFEKMLRLEVSQEILILKMDIEDIESKLLN